MRDFLSFNLILLAALFSVVPFIGNHIAASICNLAAEINQDCTHRFKPGDFD